MAVLEAPQHREPGQLPNGCEEDCLCSPVLPRNAQELFALGLSMLLSLWGGNLVEEFCKGSEGWTPLRA